MPRSSITPYTPLGSYPTIPLSAGTATVAPVAADTVNLNQAAFGSNNQLLVIALNTDTALPHNVTISSANDSFGRKGDIATYAVAAAPGTGESRVAVFGPFKRDGWVQSDKQLYFQGDHATIKFIVVKL